VGIWVCGCFFSW